MDLKQLREEAIKILKAHPDLKPQIQDLFSLAISEVQDGESESNECELAYRDMIELKNQANNNKMEKGGKLTESQQAKFDKIMKEWKAGKLHSGSPDGPIVKDQDQAIAIAYAEINSMKKMVRGGNINTKKLFDLEPGDVFEVIHPNHTLGGQLFQYIDLSDKYDLGKYGKITIKAFPFPSKEAINNNPKKGAKYIADLRDGDIEIIDPEHAKFLLRDYNEKLEMHYKMSNNNYKEGGETNKMLFGGMINNLSYDAIDRMEGLALNSELEELLNLAKYIILDLENEGFEKDEVMSFLAYKISQIGKSSLLYTESKEEEDELALFKLYNELSKAKNIKSLKRGYDEDEGYFVKYESGLESESDYHKGELESYTFYVDENDNNAIEAVYDLSGNSANSLTVKQALNASRANEDEKMGRGGSIEGLRDEIKNIEEEIEFVSYDKSFTESERKKYILELKEEISYIKEKIRTFYFYDEKMSKGGGVEPVTYYVAYTSYFDTNKYDEDKIIKALTSIGATDIHLENENGQSNQPEVVVFKYAGDGTDYDPTKAVQKAFNTDWIIVRVKDWRTKKMKDGGGVEKDSNYYEIIRKIENNERLLKNTYGSERVEQIQQEIQRLKDKLKNKYGYKYSYGGGIGEVIYQDKTIKVIKPFQGEPEEYKEFEVITNGKTYHCDVFVNGNPPEKYENRLERVFRKLYPKIWKEYDEDYAYGGKMETGGEVGEENYTIKIDIIYDDTDPEEVKEVKAIWKKYNIKAKEIEQYENLGGFYKITGKKKDIVAYLTSKTYGMDMKQIEEFLPELLERKMSTGGGVGHEKGMKMLNEYPKTEKVTNAYEKFKKYMFILNKGKSKYSRIMPYINMNGVIIRYKDENEKNLAFITYMPVLESFTRKGSISSTVKNLLPKEVKSDLNSHTTNYFFDSKYLELADNIKILNSEGELIKEFKNNSSFNKMLEGGKMNGWKHKSK